VCDVIDIPSLTPAWKDIFLRYQSQASKTNSLNVTHNPQSILIRRKFSFWNRANDRAEFGILVVKALGYKAEGREFETRWGEILNLSNPSGRTTPWGSLSLEHKWVPETLKKKFMGSKVLPVRGADNLTVTYEAIV
jgi:hypothetical protein